MNHARTIMDRVGALITRVFEPIWWGLCDATGVSWLNRKLTLRRDRKDLELAQLLRTAGMTEQAGQIVELVVQRRVARRVRP